MGLRKVCGECGYHNTLKRKYIKRTKLTNKYWCKNCYKFVSITFTWVEPKNKYTVNWLHKYNRKLAA